MLKDTLKRYKFIIPFGLSLYILDFFLRYQNLDINFGSMIALAPSFFTLAWVVAFAAIILFLTPRFRKIIYIVIITFFTIMLVVNFTYYNVFNIFFSFKSIALAGEGMNYFTIVFSYLKLPLILVLVLSIILAVITCILFPKNTSNGDKVIALIFIIMAFGLYNTGIHFLGAPTDKLVWDAWKYKRNIYDEFTETRKSLQVSGLYEYIIRDIKLTFFTNDKVDPNTTKYLDEYFARKNTDISTFAEADFSGKFEDKNIVFVLMESIDSWLVTEKTMPTLYKMMNEGINFTNHFSPVYGGGATFNSEFTTNTGYMTPFNGGTAAYYYGTNTFPYALPNLLKAKGYDNVNEFHLNYGTFYNRKQMSEAFGYDNYYGSYDMKYPPIVAIKDTHFMTEKKLRDLVLPNNKFMSYIVTYSAHMPYSLSSIECQVAIPDEEDRKKALKDEEMSCITAQAKETDNFFALLLESLKKKGILDDTIIVGVADHYSYAFTDKERLFQIKDVKDENLIGKVPFFIWGSDVPSYEVTAVNSNLDVLPTLADLLGLNYKPNYYLGRNILDPNYKGFVFFSDYSWYDGEVYYKNNEVLIGTDVDPEYIKSRSKQVSEILDVNKKVLETNYFSTLSTD